MVRSSRRRLPPVSHPIFSSLFPAAAVGLLLVLLMGCGAARSSRSQARSPQADASSSPVLGPSDPADSDPSAGAVSLSLGPVETPLSAEVRGVFHESEEDSPPVERGGVTDARKNKQYLTGNEKSLFAFHAAIANLGGGYVGVGSDQAYLFIGWARPQLAWLTDYDPDVVRIHRVHRAFFLAFTNPSEFVAAWTKERGSEAVAAIEAHNPDADAAELVRLYTIHRAFIHRRLVALRRAVERRGLPSYLNDDEHYEYVRAMVRHDRIRPMLVNLLDPRGMKGVSAAARTLGLPIRVLYLSNAEEYWPGYSRVYRDNIASLPVDEQSVLLRTLLIWNINQDYRYNIQPLSNYQEWLASPFIQSVYDIVHARPEPVSQDVNVFYTNDSPLDSPRARQAARTRDKHAIQGASSP